MWLFETASGKLLHITGSSTQVFCADLERWDAGRRREGKCMRITDSLCCTEETNTL